jgi:excisionase family DNA binding protein
MDSDGYIGVGKKKAGKWAANYQPRVQVKQVDTEATDLFRETFGGHLYRHEPSTERGRPLWCWQVHSAACRPVLEALLPYLRIKTNRAENALALCEVNRRLGRKRFPVPDVVPGEPMLTMAEVARRTGRDYGTVIQAVRKGSIPHVRTGPRKVLIPESFLPVWAERGRTPRRDPALTDEMEALYLRAKELNRVGI